MSKTLIKQVTLEFYYLGNGDSVLHKEAVSLTNLKSGETRTSGSYLRPVAGYKKVAAAVVDLDY